MKNFLLILFILFATSLFGAENDNNESTDEMPLYEITYTDESSEVVIIYESSGSGMIMVKMAEGENVTRLVQCNTIKEIYIEDDWKNDVLIGTGAGAAAGSLIGGITALPGAVIGGLFGFASWGFTQLTQESQKSKFCP